MKIETKCGFCKADIHEGEGRRRIKGLDYCMNSERNCFLDYARGCAADPEVIAVASESAHMDVRVNPRLGKTA